MLLKIALEALWASSTLASALPASSKPNGFRLIKTSETDLGTWVSEEDKITKYRAKNINFIDVTDIKDAQTLKKLSGDSDDNARAAAITYPTSVSHQTEANGLIAKASVTNPQSWLKTLSESVCPFIHDIP